MKKGFWTVVQDIIRKSDVVLEVLDARFPELTRIKKIEEYASKYNKPLIFIINKSDLVTKNTLKKNIKNFNKENIVKNSDKDSKSISNLIIKIKSKTKLKNAKIAIIGYPNTGKSTLINKLSRGSRAPTSSESGYTRGLQLIAGKSNLRLFDTPGIIPFQDRDEIRSGLVSGISPSKLKNPDLVAYKLIHIIQKNNQNVLEKTYNINPIINPEKFLEELGKKYNMLKKGGIIDERRAAIKLLTDWHDGKIKL